MPLRWIALIVAVVPFSQEDSRDLLAIRCGKIYTVSHGVINGGVILVDRGRIVDVRAGTEVPKGARLIDASAEVVVPGLIHAGPGLEGRRAARESLAPEVKAIDGFDPLASGWRLLSAGITSVYLAPGSSRLLVGRGAVVRTGGPERVLRETHGLHVILGEGVKNPPEIFSPPVPPSADNPIRPARKQYPRSRMGEFAELRRIFREARDRAGRPDPRAGWTVDRVAAFAKVIKGDEPVYFETRAADDIVKAVRLAEREGLKAVVVGADEAYRVAAFLAERRIPVAYRVPYVPRRASGEDSARPAFEAMPDMKGAGILAKAGVRLALVGESRHLLFVAGAAIRWGLSSEAALRAVTLTPAEILGVADRVGSIERGKQADLVFLSADPFQASAVTRRVMVQGRFVYRRKPSDDRTDRVLTARARRGKATRLAIRAGKIHSLAEGVIRDGLILIEDGKIVYVGRSRPVPSGVRVIDASKDVVIPGMIDLDSRLGFHAEMTEAERRRARGQRTGIPRTVTAPVAELIRADDPAFRSAAKSGVTSVLVAPADGGPCSLIKSSGTGGGIVRTVAGYKFVVGGGSSQREFLRNRLKSAKKYHDDWEAWERKPRREEKSKPARKATAPPKKADAITGTWAGTLEIKQYGIKAAFRAELRLAGTRVSGELTVTMRGQSQTQNIEGSYDNNTLRLVGEQQGARYEITMNLIAADQLKGTWRVRMGGQELSGAIEAQRISGGADGAETSTAGASGRGEKPRKNEALEPLRPLFRKEIPALVSAPNYPALENALLVFRKEFDLPLVILGSPSAAYMADRLFQYSAAAAFGPEFLSERRGATLNAAEVLASRGVPLAFRSGTPGGTRLLPMTAAFAVRHGMDPRDVLKAVTLTPARLLRLQSRIGAIEPGRDADLVILSGDPFDLSSRVKTVLIDGRVVVGNKKQKIRDKR